MVQVMGKVSLAYLKVRKSLQIKLKSLCHNLVHCWQIAMFTTGQSCLSIISPPL